MRLASKFKEKMIVHTCGHGCRHLAFVPDPQMVPKQIVDEMYVGYMHSHQRRQAGEAGNTCQRLLETWPDLVHPVPLLFG
jgi:hypothetical protein